jgi:hypothetical protein
MQPSQARSLVEIFITKRQKYKLERGPLERLNNQVVVIDARGGAAE